jgi:hypothetical protein
MRDVIEEFPVSPEVNQAYYYIGLGHFQQGHYSRAITALEKVGTTLTAEDSNNEKLEAAKRFFVKVEDADLAVLTSEDSVDVICKSSGGDQETVQCFPIGRNVRIVLGSIPTKLGVPVPGNGVLEVKGGDTVDILYTDAHTADKTINVEVLSTVTVVGDGIVQIKDGAFVETIKGVVLGKTVNVEVVDADRDISAGADQVQATVSIYRRKTDEEIETETADLIAKQEIPTDDEAAKALVDVEDLAMFDEEEKIDRFKLIEQFPVTLTEVVVQRELSTRFNLSQESDTDEGDDSKQNPDGAPAPTAEPAPAVSSAIHSGVFRATVSVIRSDASISDQVLQALPSDQVRVTYEDKLNTGEGIAVLTTSGRCLEGNIGGVRVTRALISDQALRVQTQLKTADALTRIGNRYKEFGLEKKADEKYKLALSICEIGRASCRERVFVHV